MSRILIIKLGALGDIIMATSVIEQIIEHHNADTIQLLTTPGYAALFEGKATLQITALPRKGLRSFFSMLAWIRKQKIDRVYDLQSNDRTGLLCALSGISERVGNHPRFPYTIHPPDAYRGQSHIYERMLQILAAANISPRHSLPILPSDENTQLKVNAFLKSNNLQKLRLVVMHAGASHKHPEKCWPGFSLLANKLKGSGLHTIWVGTEEDAAINSKLVAVCGTDATACFSVLELAELGRRAKFAVTNDSGPMHILSASSIPVYALFGPTNWQRNHAIGQKSNVITASGTASFTAKDIGTVSVTTVIERLKKDHLID